MYIYVFKFIKRTGLNTLAGRLWPASRMFASMVLHTDACNLTKISWIFVQTQHRGREGGRDSLCVGYCVCVYVCVGGCLPIDPRRRESWLVSSSKPQSHQSSSRGGLICCLPERISRFFVFPKYENPLHFRLHLHVRMNNNTSVFHSVLQQGLLDYAGK